MGFSLFQDVFFVIFTVRIEVAAMQSFCSRGRGCLPQCMLGYIHTLGQTPLPQADIPYPLPTQSRHPPWADTPSPPG